MLFSGEKQGERMEMKQLSYTKFCTQDCSELISFMSPLSFHVPIVYWVVPTVVCSFSTATFLSPKNSLQFIQEHSL